LARAGWAPVNISAMAGFPLSGSADLNKVGVVHACSCLIVGSRRPRGGSNGSAVRIAGLARLPLGRLTDFSYVHLFSPDVCTVGGRWGSWAADGGHPIALCGLLEFAELQINPGQKLGVINRVYLGQPSFFLVWRMCPGGGEGAKRLRVRPFLFLKRVYRERV
jgi:hypothetical protein